MAKVMSMVESLTVEDVENAINMPLRKWAHQCHAVSLAIVKSDLLPVPSRVARGTHKAILGQHSWVVVDGDPYDPGHLVLDCTLWSYDALYPVVHVTEAWDGYVPKGAGSIYQTPAPVTSGGDPIRLDMAGLSLTARVFLEALGELDARGWMMLANAPVGHWPSQEIIEAMLDHPTLRAFVPVDVAGMLTDRNPGGLYMKEEV